MGVEELVEELLIVHANLNTAFINQYLCICGWDVMEGDGYVWV